MILLAFILVVFIVITKLYKQREEKIKLAKGKNEKLEQQELVNIVKEHSKKLILNKLVDNPLEIPNKSFTHKYLQNFKDFLLVKENIDIKYFNLKNIIETTKFEIYRKEILKRVDQKDLNNLDSFIKAYSNIYGNQIDKNYIEWMKKISNLKVNIGTIIIKIEEENRKKKKENEINEIESVIDSSKSINQKDYNKKDVFNKKESNHSLKQNELQLINCPACGKSISSQAENCIHCGHPISQRRERKKENKKITCPTCGSKNIKKISKGNKVGSAVLWGVFSIGKISKTFECKDCEYRW